MEISELKIEADARHILHLGQPSSRPLSVNYELVGLSGEEAFANRYKLQVDMVRRPYGNKGINFQTKIGSIDVLTARKAFNLIVEEGKVRADIYVLAKYNDASKEATLLGWANKKEVLAAPQRDFGYGIINHFIPVAKLHSMNLLDTKLEENIEAAS